MKRIIVLFSLSALCLSCASDVNIEDVTGSVVGIVADKTTGEPVPVVNLTLTPGGNSTVTGNDGSFSFTELDEGNYTVRLEKKGYKSGNADLIVAAGINTEAHLLIERIPAVITVDHEILDFGDNASMNIMSFSIINNNYVDLEFRIEANCDWITEISPSTGTLKYGKTGTVVIEIDRNKLQAGENKTIVVINTSDGSSEVTVIATGAERKIPTINVAEVSEIRATSAILNGEITDKGVPEYSERGFVLSDFEMPTKENAIKVVTASVNGEMEFSARADDLILGKTYFVRAYAVNEIGTGYSTNQTKFTTIAILPQVTTLTASSEDRENKSAVLRGNITYEGDPSYYERGFVWSTIYQNPTIDDEKVIVTGNGIGEYEKRVTFPIIDQTIYVRAYANNERGTAYGDAIEVFPIEYIILKELKLGVQKDDLNSSSLSWETANSMCANSAEAGVDDWRLPTKNELLQLYVLKDEIGGFNSNKYTYYWSSTWGYGSDYGSYNDGYVRVHFYNGEAGTTYSSSSPAKRARCVRTL